MEGVTFYDKQSFVGNKEQVDGILEDKTLNPNQYGISWI